MSRRIWGFDLRRLGAGLSRAEDGAAAIDFGLVLPLLVAVSLGVLEFSLASFEYHRAAESTRRGARIASIVAPVASLVGIETVSPIVCREPDGTLACGGAAVANASSFATILGAMREVLPGVAPANLEVAYAASGVGDASTPGGIKPLVSVRLVNLGYELALMRAVPGVPSRIGFPAFATTYLARGTAAGA